MCHAFAVFIIVCAFFFKLNSAWQTKGLRIVPYERAPPGEPEPIPIWPEPPPDEEFNFALFVSTPSKITAWQQNGLRTRSTPPPTTTTSDPNKLPPEPIWPLPPPGKDFERQLIVKLKKSTRVTTGTPEPIRVWPLPPPGKDFERQVVEQITKRQLQGLRTDKPSNINYIHLGPVETLPFWERHDPKPARKSFPKHKRSRKKTSEKNPSTQIDQDNTINIGDEDKKANSKWPKVRNPGDRRRDYVRSTRLAPYEMLQDEPVALTAVKETPSDAIMDGLFNQYSMKNDLEIMLRDINESNVTVEVLTKTVEYNDIVICKITQSKLQSRYFRAEEDKYIDEEPQKKIIFIVHGLSAMGFTLVPCLNEKKSFMKLLKYYTAHLDKFDIFIVPMANPDGIGDETLDYWNKNKSPQAACLGVALDRNFDVSWNASASNSCNQQFPGPAPFSEPESRAIGDVLHHYSHKIVAYIHVHAGTYDPDIFKGDAVLYPKGFTEVATEDDKYIDIKGEIDEAIRNAGFKVMSVSMESLYNWYGKVHGSSVDFAATIYGVPYAMEFVMQPYEDNVRALNSEERVSDNVLTEIWKRVIDVTFTNIYKNTRANDVK